MGQRVNCCATEADSAFIFGKCVNQALGYLLLFPALSRCLREEPVRQHLKNVYACLTMSTIAASVGAYVHVFTQLLSAGFLTVIGSMGLLVALMATPDNGKNRKLRLGYLLGFAFFTGLGMGPLLEMVIQVDPSIIVTALIGTVVIFVSFTLSSLMAERGRWLYLGGTLMSLLSALLVLSLANLFIGSYLIFQSLKMSFWVRSGRQHSIFKVTEAAPSKVRGRHIIMDQAPKFDVLVKV
uniref:Bax inhibitor 1 n=1 Tax=Timema bartmani TaxID=61472 RepID=A0A7R9F0U6_9NEOP|nr:unnamed protein product [Timema bartmani]